MKNWIIVLLIFAVPLGLYAYLSNSSERAQAEQSKVAVENKKPRVIKFYSPLCSDCKKVSKEMVGVIEDYKDAVVFEEVNVSENTKKNQALIKKYKVTLVPTLIFETRDGKVIKKTEGFIEDDQIEEHIEKIK